ncbi:hypothetical protein PG993_001193 [Apiospora rasikravindrae]|uniref:Uncharacterized protein n=1 Tax=Apiospora rasikravindrae TaxID=990691 RepID=A0ABR1UAP0_9PEZI
MEEVDPMGFSNIPTLGIMLGVLLATSKRTMTYASSVLARVLVFLRSLKQKKKYGESDVPGMRALLAAETEGMHAAHFPLFTSMKRRPSEDWTDDPTSATAAGPYASSASWCRPHASSAGMDSSSIHRTLHRN